jgi:endonuclease III
MNRSPQDVATAVLDRYGRTYAQEAGIRLADQPAPLFQLLVLAQVLSARINAGIAMAAAQGIKAAGWTTAVRMREAPRGRVIAVLGRAGYRRYDERTATQLKDMAALVLEKYGGDLRRLAVAADADVERAAKLLREVDGIGPTGAAVFLREVQAVWPWVRPRLDQRALEGARRVALPADEDRLAELVPGNDLARFAAGLVRISLLPRSTQPLEGPLAEPPTEQL